LEEPAAQATFSDACGAADALVHRRDRLEREIVALLPDSPWQLQVARLRCLRAIDTLSAVDETTGAAARRAAGSCAAALAASRHEERSRRVVSTRLLPAGSSSERLDLRAAGQAPGCTR
jgi:hypothetical protein